MTTIKLPSFEIAVHQKGDEAAEKLMICLPGRLDTKDYAHMRSHVDYFAEREYLALSFDPPGTWESGDDINDYTTGNYLQVIKELVGHFGNRPTVLLGHSRGGSMAMLGSSVIDEVTHMISVMSHIGPSEPNQKAIDAGVYISKRDTPEQYKEDEITFHLPLSYFEEGKQYDFAEIMQQNTKPKLLMYGTKDLLVTKEDVIEGFELSAEPKELHGLDCDHDYRNHPAAIDEVNKRVEEFLNAN